MITCGSIIKWPSGKSVRLGRCRLGFDSELGQTNDFMSRVKPMTVFIASLLDAQLDALHSVENKPASLLVVRLGKALSGIPPSWCGRQMAGNS